MKGKRKIHKEWYALAGVILVLVAVVLLFWYFLRGETVVVEKPVEDVKNISLHCEGDGIDYSFFKLDDSEKKTALVNILFDDDILRSISITLSLYYNTEEEINASSAHNHAAMNISFGENGFDADAFSASYSKQSDRFVMSLYANDTEFNEVSGRYFLAKGLNKKSGADGFMRNYKNLGFTCTKSE